MNLPKTMECPPANAPRVIRPAREHPERGDARVCYHPAMRAAALGLLTGLLVSLGAGPAPGQEGHPLTGTWSGDWGPSTSARTHITLVMTWDGKAVSGTINPGPDGVTVPSIQLDVTSWTVRFTATTKTAAGVETIAADGRIDDIGSPHRTIAGTWRQGRARGTFKLTRD